MEAAGSSETFVNTVMWRAETGFGLVIGFTELSNNT
jgi:hypothetical protein